LGRLCLLSWCIESIDICNFFCKKYIGLSPYALVSTN
jgi:hypothetical protein